MRASVVAFTQVDVVPQVVVRETHERPLGNFSHWPKRTFSRTGWRERCSKPMSGRMPANSFWPGATRRGSGTTVRAAIMICDLRDFTRISDNWPRDDVIDLLNG